jgi:hypothetical protein
MCALDRAALLRRLLELEAQLAQARQERDDWRALVLRPERTEWLRVIAPGETVALVTSSSSNGHELP